MNSIKMYNQSTSTLKTITSSFSKVVRFLKRILASIMQGVLGVLTTNFISSEESGGIMRTGVFINTTAGVFDITSILS